MGCGCGKNKKKNMKSSRMPSNKPLKKIGNIAIPENMSPNQRRSTIAKINNDKKSTKDKSPKAVRKRKLDIRDKMMIAKINAHRRNKLIHDKRK